VLVLAVIHDPADGRIRLGSDLDQVEIGFSGNGQGLGQGKNADLLAIRTDQPHLASADAVVDPGFVVGRRSYRRSLLIDAQTPPSHVFRGLVGLAPGPKTTTRTPGSRRPLRADPLRPIDPDAHGQWTGGRVGTFAADRDLQKGPFPMRLSVVGYQRGTTCPHRR